MQTKTWKLNFVLIYQAEVVAVRWTGFNENPIGACLGNKDIKISREQMYERCRNIVGGLSLNSPTFFNSIRTCESKKQHTN